MQRQFPRLPPPYKPTSLIARPILTRHRTCQSTQKRTNRAFPLFELAQEAMNHQNCMNAILMQHLKSLS